MVQLKKKITDCETTSSIHAVVALDEVMRFR